MKKSTILAIASICLLLTSCKDDPVNEVTERVVTYNYVAHLDGTQDPVIKKGYYSLKFDYINRDITISTDMVDLGNDEDTGFTTEKMPYTYVYYPIGVDGESYQVYHGGSLYACTASNGMEVKDLRYEFSSNFYTPPFITYNPDPSSALPQPDLSYKARTGFAPKMRYVLGDEYIVYTFWTDLYYKGETKTEVMGVEGSQYSTHDVGYRIKFDLTKKKATVVMYNVQFNNDMPPMECLILPNLDVDFTNGYKIEATNVNPLYIEGGKLMENPRFPFTTFKFTAENNMVEGNCEFTVAGRFYGNFTGHYMEMAVR
ncbi:MAG: hypothetical protein K2H18_01905 [Muribaculaceae bacterium]|nr:hypothetical protein [Muribaculaceae bacterium]